jgi:recombination protein RecR
VFRNWRVEEFEAPDGVTFRLGADFGFSIDPSVLVRCYIEGRNLYIDHEAWQIGCEIDRLPDLFMSVPEAEDWPMVADSSRPETISHLRRHGFPRILSAVKGPRSVEEGVEFLKSFDIIVHPRCQHVVDELGRLPGVGPKSAQRIAFHLLKLPTEDALRIATAIAVVKERVSFCTICFNVSEGDACGICSDTRREASVVCVVEEPRDIVAVEKTGEYRGRYHVLQGAISPIEGIGPDQLRVKELLARIEPEGIEEVILCTNPNIEGEATAMYLGRLLKPLGIRVTRIASGLPVGGDLEYADELTLGRALEGRRDVE